MDYKFLSKFNMRQYMLEKYYEVFYYGDINLKHVSSHEHNYYEFYFFLNGDVDYRLGNKTYHLNQGDMLIIPPGVKHKAFIKDNTISYQRFVLWIKSEFIEEIAKEDPDFIFFVQFIERYGHYHYSLHSIDFQSLISYLVELTTETQNRGFCSGTRGKLLAANVLVQINRILYYFEQKKEKESKKELYLNLASYITSHLNQELSLDNLAKIFFISKYHMAHNFKDNMGISIHQYILNKRLEMAKVYILSGTAVSKVPLSCGFKDYATFYRAFRKGFGVSPTEFKEKYNVSSYFNPTGDTIP